MAGGARRASRRGSPGRAGCLAARRGMSCLGSAVRTRTSRCSGGWGSRCNRGGGRGCGGGGVGGVVCGRGAGGGGVVVGGFCFCGAGGGGGAPRGGAGGRLFQV